MFRVRLNWTPLRPARVVLRRALEPARVYPSPRVSRAPNVHPFPWEEHPGFSPFASSIAVLWPRSSCA